MLVHQEHYLKNATSGVEANERGILSFIVRGKDAIQGRCSLYLSILTGYIQGTLTTIIWLIRVDHNMLMRLRLAFLLS